MSTNKKDLRGRNIKRIEPVVDMVVRDIESNNNILCKVQDKPFTKAKEIFRELELKLGFKQTLWEQWEQSLIQDIQSFKSGFKGRTLFEAIKDDFNKYKRRRRMKYGKEKTEKGGTSTAQTKGKKGQTAETETPETY